MSICLVSKCRVQLYQPVPLRGAGLHTVHHDVRLLQGGFNNVGDGEQIHLSNFMLKDERKWRAVIDRGVYGDEL